MTFLRFSNLFWAFIMCVYGASSFATISNKAVAFASFKDRIPSQMIVKFKESKSNETDYESAFRDLEEKTGYSIAFLKSGALGMYLIEVSVEEELLSEKETLIAVARFNEEAALLYANENSIVRPAWYNTENEGEIPDDPYLLHNSRFDYFNFQWALGAMDMEHVWLKTKGSKQQLIGVLDTGLIRNHEDLKEKDVYGYDFIGRLLYNQRRFDLGSDGNGWDKDYSDVSKSTTGMCKVLKRPENFHGTFIAGLIAATTNNNIGISGMNPNAGIISVRVMDGCYGGTQFDILNGLAWLGGEHVPKVPDLPADKQVSVINMSIADSPFQCDQAYIDLTSVLVSRNKFLVVAAGNHNKGVGSPANCPGVISVAASSIFTNSEGEIYYRKSSYSNIGNETDIVAIGGDHNNSHLLSTHGPEADSYTSGVGTSFSAPHVAAAISLLLDIEPSLTINEVKGLFARSPRSCVDCQGKRMLDLNLIIEDLMINGPPGDYVDTSPLIGGNSIRSNENKLDESMAIVDVKFTAEDLLEYDGREDYKGSLGPFKAKLSTEIIVPKSQFADENESSCSSTGLNNWSFLGGGLLILGFRKRKSKRAKY